MLPLLAGAGDSLLPFSNLSAAATGQSAFSNPAAAAFGSGTEYGTSLAEWDAVDGTRERLWTGQYQGPGQGLGLRYYNGSGPYQARLDLSLATQWMDLLSPGLKFSYISSGFEPDHGMLEVGLNFRPWRQLLVGYWGENLWSGGLEQPIQHFALALKPFASLKGWSRDLQVGLAVNKQDGRAQRGYLFTQIPIFRGFRLQAQWDEKHKESSLSLILQATSQWTGALGWSKGSLGTDKYAAMGGTGTFQPKGREVAISFSPEQRLPYLVGTGSVAEINLNATWAEGRTETAWFGTDGNDSFLDLLNQFEVLDANPRIHSVVVKLGRARCGWAMAEEIRRRLMRLRSQGKHLVAYMEQVTPLNYFLASAANVIALQPEGYFAVTGFAAEVTFYRGFFDKVGVEPQFLRHGKYKSFEEPYMRKSFSEPARADLNNYLGSLWDHYLGVVAKARKLSVDSLRQVLESGEIGLSHALKAGLIDTLVHADQVLKLAGGPDAALVKNLPKKVYRNNWDLPPKIAVVVVTGDMVLGNSARGWLAGPDLAGSETVARQLRQARMTPGVVAVVLRVDSPGGSAQAADIMAREVDLLKEAHIPVVASVGHNAASGGYYLICGADRIIAEPNSTVGSIGVLWGKFILSGLYAKLGLNVETVKTSPHADGNSMSRAWDSSEVVVLQRHMDQFYTDFVAKVAAGRHKSKTYIDSLGQGRIFTGTQAFGNGLIDTLGGLMDAVDLAATLAGLKTHGHFDLEIFDGSNKHLGLSTLDRNWARAPSALSVIESEMLRWKNFTQPGLWAISPELAGWINLPGTGPE